MCFKSPGQNPSSIKLVLLTPSVLHIWQVSWHSCCFCCTVWLEIGQRCLSSSLWAYWGGWCLCEGFLFSPGSSSTSSTTQENWNWGSVQKWQSYLQRKMTSGNMTYLNCSFMFAWKVSMLDVSILVKRSVFYPPFLKILSRCDFEGVLWLNLPAPPTGSDPDCELVSSNTLNSYATNHLWTEAQVCPSYKNRCYSPDPWQHLCLQHCSSRKRLRVQSSYLNQMFVCR